MSARLVPVYRQNLPKGSNLNIVPPQWSAAQKRWLALAPAARYQASVLAKLCGVCPRQLQRQFQLMLGCCPQKWLDGLRLAEIEKRLLAGEQLKKALSELGYAHSSTFYRQYRAWRKMPPLQFLVQCAQNSEPGNAVMRLVPQ
jgi:AraC-like DNA-binding protein